MKANDLLIASANYDDGTHERKIGHYYCSEIYSIRKGYLKPEQFFEERVIDLQGAMNIEGGNTDEEGWARVLKRNNIKFIREPKKVMNIEDIELVVKPDFIINGKILLETKSPTKITRTIPDKWKDQLEAEYRAFELPVYLGVFRNNPYRRFSLEEIKYEPSERRWENIKNIIVDFHTKLCNLHDSN
jgi:hypothetical protein